MLPKLQSVQTYFDSDAGRYGDQRYPEDPKTCEQFSYLVRRRYVLDMLGRGAPTPGRILDLGCGPGVYTKDLLDRGWQLWGVDIAPKMLKVAQGRTEGRPGAGFAVGQTTKLPFASGAFDAVVCIGVLAYVESEESLFDPVLPSGVQWTDVLGEVDARVRAVIERDAAFTIHSDSGVALCRSA